MATLQKVPLLPALGERSQAYHRYAFRLLWLLTKNGRGLSGVSSRCIQSGASLPNTSTADRGHSLSVQVYTSPSTVWVMVRSTNSAANSSGSRGRSSSLRRSLASLSG